LFTHRLPQTLRYCTKSHTIVNCMDNSTINYCSLSDRVKSIFIDTFIIIMAMLVFSTVLDMFNNPPVWARVAMFIAIWFLYEPFCVAYGCTIGQYVMHIRVRSAKDTTKHIHIVLSYIRYIIKIALGWLSFLSLAFNKQRQAVHDLAVESVMIKVV
jgi:uncharacterized RDD family membrane protein YckC